MCPKKPIKSTNPEFASLIRLLVKKSNENNVSIWKEVAKKISRPKEIRISVNVGRINRNTKENEQVVVPGKVLGAGTLNHAVTVAALDFSEQARLKIIEAKGNCLTLYEIIEANPKGVNVRIIG